MPTAIHPPNLARSLMQSLPYHAPERRGVGAMHHARSIVASGIERELRSRRPRSTYAKVAEAVFPQ